MSTYLPACSADEASYATKPPSSIEMAHATSTPNAPGSWLAPDPGAAGPSIVDSTEKPADGITAGPAPAPPMSTPRITILAFVIMLTFFVGAASTSSVTVLIPVIARDLDTSELQAQWVSSAYTLAYGCGLLFSGRLADILGRRKMHMAGLAIYAIFAIVTGAFKSRVAMSITRALSGLGLAIASPAGVGIIGSNILHEPARTIVFAAFGAGGPVGAAFGNLIGGAMASIGHWSYLFYLLAGIAVVNLIMAYFVTPVDRIAPEGVRQIDWVGGGLITSAICLFTFSLTDSGIAPKGWRAPRESFLVLADEPDVPALLTSSIILFTLFILWSRRLEQQSSLPPIIKPSLFTRRQGLVGYTCASLFFLALSAFGWVYTSTIFYQNVKGYTPLQNSIATLPSLVSGMVAALSVMYLAPRVRAPYLLCIGAVLNAGASILYAAVPEGLSYWAMEFPALLMIPWGIDLFVAVGGILVSNLVDQDEQSVGGALFQTSAQVGAALGICLTALIVTQVGEEKGRVMEGVRAALWFGAAVGGIVIPIAFFGFRHVKLAQDVGKMER